MMKLFHTPASHFTRKCTVTIKELGLDGRVEIIPTRWPHAWVTETVPYRRDFLDATPIARIPALVTDDGTRLTDSSTICQYLNDELGDYRLCPQRGAERWRILSMASIATSGIMEAQVMRIAELRRKRPGAANPQEHSPSFVQKMKERQARCFSALEQRHTEFAAEPDLGLIAVACACATSDFRFPEDGWRDAAPSIARWYDKFRLRRSLRETEPAETPQAPDVEGDTSMPSPAANAR
jgi:glutathione S-transferase